MKKILIAFFVGLLLAGQVSAFFGLFKTEPDFVNFLPNGEGGSLHFIAYGQKSEPENIFFFVHGDEKNGHLIVKKPRVVGSIFERLLPRGETFKKEKDLAIYIFRPGYCNKHTDMCSDSGDGAGYQSHTVTKKNVGMVKSAISKAVKHFNPSGKVFGYGFSGGGSFVLLAAAFGAPLDGIIVAGTAADERLYGQIMRDDRRDIISPLDYEPKIPVVAAHRDGDKKVPIRVIQTYASKFGIKLFVAPPTDTKDGGHDIKKHPVVREAFSYLIGLLNHT